MIKIETSHRDGVYYASTDWPRIYVSGDSLSSVLAEYAIIFDERLQHYEEHINDLTEQALKEMNYMKNFLKGY